MENEEAQADGDGTQLAPRDADVQGEIDLNPAKALERIDGWLDGLVKLIPNLLIALVFLMIAWFATKWIGRLINRSATRRDRDNLGDMLGGFARWGLFLFAVLIALTIVMPTLKPGDLVAGLGVSSVAIGFAFKDILQNWLAGLLLLLRQPFEVGDQIEVGGYEGTVERIETRATLLRTYGGRRVVIPNSDIYTDAVVVKTAFEHARNEYDVGIGYGDDIDAAREAMLDAVRSVGGVEADPAPEALVWGLDASWVTVRVRWWQKPDRKSFVNIRSDVMKAIKDRMDRDGIDMPFETQVHLFHDQTEETDGQRSAQREGWPTGENDPAPARRARGEGSRQAAE